MISLDFMKLSEARKVGDQSNFKENVIEIFLVFKSQDLKRFETLF